MTNKQGPSMCCGWPTANKVQVGEGKRRATYWKCTRDPSHQGWRKFMAPEVPVGKEEK